MKKANLTVIAALAVTAIALNCGSTKSSVLKDGEGKAIGRYDVMNDHDAKANFDANQNGVNERVSTYKDQKLTGVEYFDDKTGTKTKTVSVKDGKPDAVTVYDKDGKAVRGDVVLDPATGSAKEVNLPAKNKKVVFNGDGTVSVSEIPKK